MYRPASGGCFLRYLAELHRRASSPVQGSGSAGPASSEARNGDCDEHPCIPKLLVLHKRSLSMLANKIHHLWWVLFQSLAKKVLLFLCEPILLLLSTNPWEWAVWWPERTRLAAAGGARLQGHARQTTHQIRMTYPGKGSFLPNGFSPISWCLGISEDDVSRCRNRFFLLFFFPSISSLTLVPR
jgi:hypothetical protein